MYKFSAAVLAITLVLSACVTGPTPDMTKEEAEAFVNAQRIETACLSATTSIRLAKAAKPDMSPNQLALANAAIDGIEGICAKDLAELNVNDVLRALNAYLDELEAARLGATDAA